MACSSFMNWTSNNGKSSPSGQREVLSFRSGPIKFIDSLCFLPMPFASFSSTFNLTELKKGFFPHLFNTPDHQQYVGRIPC